MNSSNQMQYRVSIHLLNGICLVLNMILLTYLQYQVADICYNASRSRSYDKICK